jgi:hypothetical protein
MLPNLLDLKEYSEAVNFFRDLSYRSNRELQGTPLKKSFQIVIIS